MHIPDGYLSPQTYVVLDIAIIPIWVVAARKVKKSLKTKQIDVLSSAISVVSASTDEPAASTRRRNSWPRSSRSRTGRGAGLA